MTADGTRAGEQSAPSPGPGRLAQVIALRGGKAPPEAPFVVEHREALIYMLCEAAELEHGIMCQYLYAAFSLKEPGDEGLAGAEQAAVQRWRTQISHVATQEMLHLALVHNLLSAIGAAPHMVRPNLPAPAGHYPAGVQLALLPFGEQALQHFMFLERPENMDLADADGLAAMGAAIPVMNERDIVPRGQDFKTVGHLYRSIEAGLDHLASKHGEDWLFVGPERAQATRDQFGWPELVQVTDLASAHRAIDEILEQGEGARGHWRDAHFGQFVHILGEYQDLCAAKEAFNPVRPVVLANVRPHDRADEVPLITDPLTARVADLFNVGYEILLQIFERYFAHTQETDAQLGILADATVALMLRVLKPLGDLITTLPAGPEFPGRTAAPSFELFYESDYLMPHREAAWSLLAERLSDAAWLCTEIRNGRGAGIAGPLQPVLSALREISASLAAHLPADSPHARLAAPEDRLAPEELDALLGRADRFRAAARSAGSDTGLGELFSSADSIVTSAAAELSGRTAIKASAGELPPYGLILRRLVDSVLQPLAAVPGTGPAPAPADGDDERPVAHRVSGAARTATRLRARLGAAGACPPELTEATAALQDLAVTLDPGPGRAGLLAEFWELQAGLHTTIQAMRDGPYLATNVPRLLDHLGVAKRPAPQLALCRCGGSSIRPLCDRACTRNGFSDAKDPDRVPDRRDTYRGEQVTIFDNRGICQHSGYCTDRVPAVFRAGKEPFVAPSGGRLDEIIRAARDCPSGALSYGLGGGEARRDVDRDSGRPPSVEVTRDGPYRITGGIPVSGAGGEPVTRARGSSLEHYALCRCGHSQNKPFCSGMHWYVGFRDPERPPGYEPTVFEWAGGIASLARMARLFYSKHVPADAELAPLFADMPPDQPERLTAWLAEAFGGPAAAVTDGAPGGQPLAEGAQRRWVTLLFRAADETGLPADPQFRSVFASCAEWLSRTALVNEAGTGNATLPAPVPRWDWGPGGPPSAAPTADEGETAAAGAPALPGPDEAVSFAAHIRPLFRERDRKSMSFAFDLWSADDVRAHSAEILQRVGDGSMPCDGAWPQEWVAALRRWSESGMRP